MLAFMIAHDRHSIGCLSEKIHDLRRFWTTVDDIADTDHRIFFPQSGLIQQCEQFRITAVDIANNQCVLHAFVEANFLPSR